jgi:hypothetical protein
MRFTTYFGMVYVNIRNGLWMIMALGLPGLPHHMSYLVSFHFVGGHGKGDSATQRLRLWCHFC